MLKSIEYLLYLRQHIQNSSRSDIPCSTTGYLDGVAYWKGLFQQSQLEIYQLQSTNSSLIKAANARDNIAPTQKRKTAAEPTLSRKVSRKLTNPVRDTQSVNAVPDVNETAIEGKCDKILYH